MFFLCVFLSFRECLVPGEFSVLCVLPNETISHYLCFFFANVWWANSVFCSVFYLIFCWPVEALYLLPHTICPILTDEHVRRLGLVHEL